MSIFNSKKKRGPKLVPAFECPSCGKLMKLSDDSTTGAEYLTIFGNVLVGETGGIYGGNLPNKSKDIESFRICIECVISNLNSMCKKETVVRSSKD